MSPSAQDREKSVSFGRQFLPRLPQLKIRIHLGSTSLTQLHSERTKLHTILAFLSAIGLSRVAEVIRVLM